MDTRSLPASRKTRQEVLDGADADIPPVWITLASAPDWLSRLFNLRGALFRRKLAAAARDGSIANRVQNAVLLSTTRLLGIDWKDPANLCSANNWQSIVDWELAPVNWQTGDLEVDWRSVSAEADEPTPIGGRNPWVELRWADVECWAEKIQPVERTSAAPLVAVRPINKGGRTVTHDWDKFWIEVAIWAGLNGFENESDRIMLRSKMCKLTATWTPPIHDATVRKKLGELFAAADARNSVPRS